VESRRRTKAVARRLRRAARMVPTAVPEPGATSGSAMGVLSAGNWLCQCRYGCLLTTSAYCRDGDERHRICTLRPACVALLGRLGGNVHVPNPAWGEIR
jgi:hypothetical protein